MSFPIRFETVTIDPLSSSSQAQTVTIGFTSGEHASDAIIAIPDRT